MATRRLLIVVAAMAVLCQFLVGWTDAALYSSTSRKMVSGDFYGDGLNEVAYIQLDGSISVYDFYFAKNRIITLPGGEAALKMVAADVDGDGVADLAIVTSNATGLRTYNFATSAFTPVAGGGIQDLAAANIDADPRDEIMVTNTLNNIYMYENGAFSDIPGAGPVLATGEFDGDATTEFVITGGGTPGSGAYVYYWNGETSNWTEFQSLGSGINRLAAGDLDVIHALDEVFLNTTAGSPFVTEGAGYVGTAGWGTEIGIGKTDPDLGSQALAYIIGGLGIIYQGNLDWGTGNFGSGYVQLPVDATSNPTPVANNSGFTDFILADIDGDALGELIGRKGGDQLFRFDNGDSGFVAVPEPCTVVLLGGGLLTLLRRRRGR